MWFLNDLFKSCYVFFYDKDFHIKTHPISFSKFEKSTLFFIFKVKASIERTAKLISHSILYVART